MSDLRFTDVVEIRESPCDYQSTRDVNRDRQQCAIDDLIFIIFSTG